MKVSQTDGDEANSLIMRPYDPLVRPAAIFFYQNWCTGPFGRLEAPKEFNVINYYTNDDMRRYNVPDDDTVSMMVPYGVSFTMYDGDSWDGD